MAGTLLRLFCSFIFFLANSYELGFETSLRTLYSLFFLYLFVDVSGILSRSVEAVAEFEQIIFGDRIREPSVKSCKKLISSMITSKQSKTYT